MSKSSRREQIRSYLTACAQQGHYSPTLREIGDAVGLSAASAVQHHTNALVREGFCERTAQGRLRLQRREPVAVFCDFPYMDGMVVAFEVPEELEQKLKLASIYRVEVYRAE